MKLIKQQNMGKYHRQGRNVIKPLQNHIAEDKYSHHQVPLLQVPKIFKYLHPRIMYSFKEHSSEPWQ